MPKAVKTSAKTSAKKKIAVVMLNLGGPDAPGAVRPFLMNFFMDKNIIPLPIPLRCFVAALIANKRSKAEAKESYDELGGSSPFIKNSQAQARRWKKCLKVMIARSIKPLSVCVIGTRWRRKSCGRFVIGVRMRLYFYRFIRNSPRRRAGHRWRFGINTQSSGVYACANLNRVLLPDQ